MDSTAKLPRLAYAAIITNAAWYLLLLSWSARGFILRHDPAWEFYECEACRQTGVSYLTWAIVLVGLVCLFLRRAEAALVIIAANVCLLIGIAWGPLWQMSRFLKDCGASVSTPEWSYLIVWPALLTVGALFGSSFFVFPSVRRALAGHPPV